jgi:hypothetical protein
MNLKAIISEMDKQATQSGDAQCWWNTCSLILTVWSNCKDGWFPVSHLDPQNNPALRDLAKAFKRFGSGLLSYANARAFGES